MSWLVPAGAASILGIAWLASARRRFTRGERGGTNAAT